MVFANENQQPSYILRGHINCSRSERSIDECKNTDYIISGLDNCPLEVFIFCLPPKG